MCALFIDFRIIYTGVVSIRRTCTLKFMLENRLKCNTDWSIFASFAGTGWLGYIPEKSFLAETSLDLSEARNEEWKKYEVTSSKTSDIWCRCFCVHRITECQYTASHKIHCTTVMCLNVWRNKVKPKKHCSSNWPKNCRSLRSEVAACFEKCYFHRSFVCRTKESGHTHCTITILSKWIIMYGSMTSQSHWRSSTTRPIIPVSVLWNHSTAELVEALPAVVRCLSISVSTPSSAISCP